MATTTQANVSPGGTWFESFVVWRDALTNNNCLVAP